jgi:hypothetical protein
MKRRMISNSPEVKKLRSPGIIDKKIKGKLINKKNRGLDKTSFVCNQKKTPVNVKLISPFL